MKFDAVLLCSPGINDVVPCISLEPSQARFPADLSDRLFVEKCDLCAYWLRLFVHVKCCAAKPQAILEWIFHWSNGLVNAMSKRGPCTSELKAAESCGHFIHSDEVYHGIPFQ